MTGTRKEPNEEGQLLLKEGEYGKGTDDNWYVRPPGCHMGCIKNHNVDEHQDGTITVSPSILVADGSKSWHGFLERGVWRKLD